MSDKKKAGPGVFADGFAKVAEFSAAAAENVGNLISKEREVGDFDTHVFPDEIKYLHDRREATNTPKAGLPDPPVPVATSPGTDGDEAPAGSEPTPAQRAALAPHPSFGLVGLALSGGGIRSATFNLGVLQCLAKRGLLPWFDYLSTVSGGGYVGASASVAFNGEATEGPPSRLGLGRSMRHVAGASEPSLIKHLRNASNYLTPGGLIDYFRIPAVLLRGIVLNLLIIVPWVGVISLMTWFMYLEEVWTGQRFAPRLEPMWVLQWPFWVFIAASILFPAVAFAFPDLPIKLRSAAERFFGFVLLGVAAALVFDLLPVAYVFLDERISGAGNAAGLVASVLALLPLMRTLHGEALDKIGVTVSAALAWVLVPVILFFIYFPMTRWVHIGWNNTPEWLASRLETISGFWPATVDLRVAQLTPSPAPWSRAAFLVVVLLTAWFLMRAFMNVNKTGLHRFYRDRLSEAYIYEPISDLHPDAMALEHLSSGASGAPLPLINAALNIPGAADQKLNGERDLQGRKADFFAFSPLWCGSTATRYARAEDLRWKDPDVNLGTAVAISGAAISPHMGSNTPSKAMVFLFALLNIRLEYWLSNPACIEESRSIARTPKVGPWYLVKEVLGLLTARSKYVNLSDGGHIENLGLYELLRRRCKYVVVSDAEQDGELDFYSLGKVTAYARMDQGIRIAWSNLDLVRDRDKSGRSKVRWALGHIDYGNDQHGQIVYMKSSMNGKEPADVLAYKANHEAFPHQPTSDQFFDESQWESYRALGYDIASDLFDDAQTDVLDIEDWFRDVEDRAREVRKDHLADG